MVMFGLSLKQLGAGAILACLLAISISCVATASNEEFFGKTVPPEKNILRYVTGDEPESLDPPVSTGQPEARLYVGLYDGLTEIHPETAQPIPSLAERWEPNQDNSEFTFHLRAPIDTAGDHAGVDGLLGAIGAIFEATNGDVKLEQQFCIGTDGWAAEWERVAQRQRVGRCAGLSQGPFGWTAGETTERAHRREERESGRAGVRECQPGRRAVGDDGAQQGRSRAPIAAPRANWQKW